ncbi:MAG: PH domain-containing protein [Stackebrandtia sp.]
MATQRPQWDTWPADVHWQSISPRLAHALLVRLFLLGVPLLGIVVVVAWLWWGPVWAGIAGALLLAGQLSQAFLIPRRVHAWGYAERDDDLLIRHGLWTRRLSIVPYGRMQFIDIRANPVDRVFELATVNLHTASAASDSTVPGLSPDAATRLRDRLAARAHTEFEGL